MPDRRIFSVLLLIGLAFGPAVAQSPKSPEDLDRVRVEKAEAEKRARALSEEAGRLAGEARKLSEALKQSADQVRAGEMRISEIEGRQRDLAESVERLNASLEQRRVSIARSLSALAGLAKVPPLAVVARPGEIADIRLSAAALAGLRPALAAQMTQLRADRSDLQAQTAQLTALRQDALATLETLRADRDRLKGLGKQKRELVRQARSGAKQAADRATQLAGKVKSLTALMKRLDEIEPVAAVTSPRQSQNFRALRGNLPLPVAGRVTSRFGEVGGISDGKGIVLVTRPEALVTAPHDAIVRFAGPFRSYGELLILDFGDGYHLLVAGLSGIDVVVGQWLLAGEPVGSMAGSGDANNRGNGPELYLELRRGGTPIDPARWLAQR